MNPLTERPGTTVADWKATLTVERLEELRLLPPKAAKSVWRQWSNARMREAMGTQVPTATFTAMLNDDAADATPSAPRRPPTQEEAAERLRRSIAASSGRDD